MKFKPFLPILISGVIFVIFVLLPASWFTGLVTDKTLADNRISLTDQVLKGTLIQNKLFESDKYYPIYGSSELGKDDPFNPGIALNKHNSSKQTFLLGTGGSTDLINAVELASQYDNLKGKKLTFIISPQWFTNHGLTNQNFDARMSQTQINQMFNQKNMPADLKKRYAQRLLQFPHAHNKSYLREQAKHPGEVSGNYISAFKENQLIKIEAIKSLFSFKKPPLAHVKPATEEDASWNEMKDKAIDIGKANTKTNKFDIRDPYWKLIKENKRKIKRDYEFNIDSPEFQDLQLLVQTLHEAGADVQYVSIPSNGRWYDHIGIDKDRRESIYKKIHSTVVDNGGKIYDMTNKDYEKYVISDAVHIGWKGWVYVDQQIAKHMDGKDPKNHKVDYSKNQPPKKDHKAHDHHEKKHHDE
ncbi:D-alanyl-lipoteichoic acid biosynthesis protein DltD [Staphylococcus capitis]|uniref:D-alanyl-lipoteichoic acid biosynthesis protein DltD n=1 Tax=Staphylococcus capitis TaxID=29388 RepID=UPI00019293B6|nr:D-alanyl-lipoteichoic acid biosynthesis protein DltD [Staphylococcus capitis]AKL91355.1 D-alanyl-lipoteichoic acid biosynthesis protein DltD [Staphylococcus capitis subsp. capitis]EEE50024.1 DltD C-terminal domain protein [Staphylococcus capitis SK14]EGS38710.1 DltD C-terminal domain protein [Staphylococcus capitis VCU116]MCC0829179.1 D-alanyl-lipoteichoic acid biosynthesis protein DltD [Staphylococcus capitis]MCC3744743.1 D-alanyl-lipoteichoic acid biosynthesis protein DltD [Staphylococcus